MRIRAGTGQSGIAAVSTPAVASRLQINGFGVQSGAPDGVVGPAKRSRWLKTSRRWACIRSVIGSVIGAS
jgi:hypothetical protein